MNVRQIDILISLAILIKIVTTAPLEHGKSCGHKIADIVFALDSSVSIKEEDFKKELSFVKNIIHQLPVSKNGAHIAVTTFGSEVYTEVPLNSFYTTGEINNAIDLIPYRKGGTFTGKAIEHAREVIFSSENGARDSVEKIMFVITDGFSSHPHNTKMQASISKSHGIIMFAVGVGHNVDQEELKDIANKPIKRDEKFVYRVDGFDSLNTIEPDLIRTACEMMQERTDSYENDTQNDGRGNQSSIQKYCSGKPADVYFVVDSSSSISDINFRSMLRFVTEVVDMFDVGSELTRVGLVAYSDGIHPIVTIDNTFEKPELKKRILDVKHLAGSTHTGSVLEYIRERGFAPNTARAGVARVVILLTDGQSVDLSKALLESKRLKASGTNLFAVGIGDQVDKVELMALASEPSDNFVYFLDNFDVLSSIRNMLAMKTCLAKGDADKMQKDEGSNMCSAGRPADVMYVFDALTLGEKKTNQLHELLSDVMTVTDDKKDIIRSGVLSKSCKSIKDIPLTSNSRARGNFEQTTKQEEVLPEILHRLRISGFDYKNGGRQDAKNIAFVFVDGRLADYHRLALESRRLKFNDKVEVYMVAIGHKGDTQLAKVSSTPSSEHVIEITGFDNLKSAKKLILRKICKRKTL